MTKKTRRAKARRALLSISLVLVMMMVAVGGTIAWLTDSTQEVKNTFTPTGINIELTETPNFDTDDDNVADAWTAELIPGKEYTKNPVVKVVREDVIDEDGKLVLRGTDVDIYLFVKFEEKGNPSEYLEYTSLLTAEKGWKQVEGTSNVYCRTVLARDTTVEWHLLDGDKVTVKSALTKEEMVNVPKEVYLKYTAYAIQTEGIEAIEGKTVEQVAWETVSK